VSPSVAGIGGGLFRLVFRGGSPERIPYSDRLLISALLATLVLGIVAQRWFFGNSVIGTGLAVFTLFSGVYLGAALLSRRAPRMRLRLGLQSLWLLSAAVQLLLIAAIGLLAVIPHARSGIGIAAGVLLLLGTINVVRYALGSSRWRVAAMCLAFAAVLGAFYSILSTLLETLYS